MKKIVEKLKKKEKGSISFFFGAYALVTILLLFMLMQQRMKAEQAIQNVEDALTTSALGVLVWEPQAVALTGDVIIYDVEQAEYDFVNLLAGNLGLQVDEIGYRNKFYAVHSNPFLDVQMDEDDCYVSRLILYNYYDSHSPKDIEVNIFDYSDTVFYTYTAEAGSVETPTGETVTSTSVYVEFVFPVKVFGKRTVVRKGEFVSIEDRI